MMIAHRTHGKTAKARTDSTDVSKTTLQIASVYAGFSHVSVDAVVFLVRRSILEAWQTFANPMQSLVI